MTDTTTEAEAAPAPQRHHWIMFADGPLAGRTALHGFWPDDAIPQRLTATAGTIFDTRPVPVAGTPGRFHYLSTGTVVAAGLPVRYELAGGAYRFAGDGWWPEDEPEAQEPPEDEEEGSSA